MFNPYRERLITVTILPWMERKQGKVIMTKDKVSEVMLEVIMTKDRVSVVGCAVRVEVNVTKDRVSVVGCAVRVEAGWEVMDGIMFKIRRLI